MNGMGGEQGGEDQGASRWVWGVHGARQGPTGSRRGADPVALPRAEFQTKHYWDAQQEKGLGNTTWIVRFMTLLLALGILLLHCEMQDLNGSLFRNQETEFRNQETRLRNQEIWILRFQISESFSLLNQVGSETMTLLSKEGKEAPHLIHVGAQEPQAWPHGGAHRLSQRGQTSYDLAHTLMKPDGHKVSHVTLLQT